MTRTLRNRAVTPLLNAFIAASAFVAIVPLVWVLCACFKQPADLFSSLFLPWDRLDSLTLDHWRFLFAKRTPGLWLANNLLITGVQTAIVVTLSSLGGFALAKYRFAGRRIVIGMMFATMLLPGVVLLPSQWLVVYRLGMIDTYAAVILPGAVSAFGMFLFSQAMRDVPDELLQAGRIDGCSELRLWWEVALPIVRPMTNAYTLLAFVASWNGYLWPALVLSNPDRHTLAIGLAGMMGLREFDERFGVLMCGVVLAVAPVMLLFLILRKEFAAGIASGAVKG